MIGVRSWRVGLRGRLRGRGSGFVSKVEGIPEAGFMADDLFWLSGCTASCGRG